MISWFQKSAAFTFKLYRYNWGVRGLPVGSDAQMSVARGMSCVARESPPKFIATLGDNFYPSGITSVDDPEFVNKVEKVYSDASMHVPWYPSIGDDGGAVQVASSCHMACERLVSTLGT